MDKLGPMCRTVEDCAVVLDAILGPDDRDPTVVDLPFNWDADYDYGQLRVGFLKDAFTTEQDEAALQVVRSLGVDPIPIALPDLPFNDISFILTVEAAAAFDELTRSNRDDELVSQHSTAWPATFRRARLVPAVEYLQANRIRTLIMHQMAELMNQVDVYVTPTLRSLYLGNFTGHPIIGVPSGFTERGAPTSIGFMGQLYGEAKLLSLAAAYQNATDYHRKHPPLKA